MLILRNYFSTITQEVDPPGLYNLRYRADQARLRSEDIRQEAQGLWKNADDMSVQTAGLQLELERLEFEVIRVLEIYKQSRKDRGSIQLLKHKVLGYNVNKGGESLSKCCYLNCLVWFSIMSWSLLTSVLVPFYLSSLLRPLTSPFSGYVQDFIIFVKY